MELGGDHYEEIIKKSESLYSQGKKLELMQMMTESMIKFPNEVKLKFMLGRYKTYIGLLEGAIDLFNEVLRLTNGRSMVDESYSLMSNCYLFLGRVNKH